jgi:hypothetical protein
MVMSKGKIIKEIKDTGSITEDELFSIVSGKELNEAV